MPRISVIVAAYNAQDTIGATISSVLNQSYPEWELLVVNDGSTDRTAEIVAAHDDRVTLINKENAGCASARNVGIAAASGDLIAWLDADDYLLPHHLEQLLDRQRSTADGRCIVTAEAYRLTLTGLSSTLLPRPFPPAKSQRRRILQGNFVGIFCLYPAQLHEEIGTLDESLTHGEDYDLWLRAILAGWIAVSSQTPSAVYRSLGGSASSDQAAMVAAEGQILNKVAAGSLAELTTQEREYVELRRQSPSPRQLTHSGDAAIRKGDWSLAHDKLRWAGRLRPDDRRLNVRARLLGHPGTRSLVRWHLAISDRRLVGEGESF